MQQRGAAGNRGPVALAKLHQTNSLGCRRCGRWRGASTLREHGALGLLLVERAGVAIAGSPARAAAPPTERTAATPVAPAPPADPPTRRELPRQDPVPAVPAAGSGSRSSSRASPVGNLGARAVEATVQQLLPPPRSGQRLDRRPASTAPSPCRTSSPGRPGLFFDQQFGLLVYAPVYLIALFGLPLVPRRLPGLRGAVLLATAGALHPLRGRLQLLVRGLQSRLRGCWCRCSRCWWRPWPWPWRSGGPSPSAW